MEKPTTASLSYAPAHARPGRRLAILMPVEFLASVAGTFISIGLYFYTTHRFGWGLRGNALMAVSQGVIYVFAALAAHGVQQRLGRVRALKLLYTIMISAALAALLGNRATFVVPAVLAYATCAGMAWPMLESLVSGNAGGHELAWRLGLYNVVWSSAGVLLMAVNGLVIARWTAGVWVIIAACHLLCLGILSCFSNLEQDAPAQLSTGHAIDAERELLAQRRLAMWMSRIALPSTYVVMISLNAMLPTLPLIKAIGPAAGTLVCTVWLAARVLAFAVLGFTSWWHTRPLWLLWAGVLMLISFLAGVIPAAHSAGTFALVSLLLWQIGLGFAMGHIYSASLYFGMALSEGSTEHGGYHEALIGLGSILGPGAGALAAWYRAGDPVAAVVAVGGVIVLSLTGAAIAAVIARRRRDRPR